MTTTEAKLYLTVNMKDKATQTYFVGIRDKFGEFWSYSEHKKLDRAQAAFDDMSADRNYKDQKIELVLSTTSYETIHTNFNHKEEKIEIVLPATSCQTVQTN